MGIPTLITTNTEAGDSTSSFTSSIDSTYDEYIFVMTDIGPDTDNVHFTFQFNASSQSGYNEPLACVAWYTQQTEAGSVSGPELTNAASRQDTAEAAFQRLSEGMGSGSDESGAGILQLFSPANTTYVTHFSTKFNYYTEDNRTQTRFVSGYVDATAAITNVQFKMSSGNFDGVIQMYGIS